MGVKVLLNVRISIEKDCTMTRIPPTDPHETERNLMSSEGRQTEELRREAALVASYEAIIGLAREFVDLSYKNSYGQIFINERAFHELAKALGMEVSDVRPWQR